MTSSELSSYTIQITRLAIFVCFMYFIIIIILLLFYVKWNIIFNFL